MYPNGFDELLPMKQAQSVYLDSFSLGAPNAPPMLRHSHTRKRTTALEGQLHSKTHIQPLSATQDPFRKLRPQWLNRPYLGESHNHSPQSMIALSSPKYTNNKSPVTHETYQPPPLGQRRQTDIASGESNNAGVHLQDASRIRFSSPQTPRTGQHFLLVPTRKQIILPP